VVVDAGVRLGCAVRVRLGDGDGEWEGVGDSVALGAFF